MYPQLVTSRRKLSGKPRGQKVQLTTYENEANPLLWKRTLGGLSKVSSLLPLPQLSAQWVDEGTNRDDLPETSDYNFVYSSACVYTERDRLRWLLTQGVRRMRGDLNGWQ